MARRGKQKQEHADNPFDVKMKPYEEALADLKAEIEQHVKKEVKYRRRADDVELPKVYRVVPRTEV